MGRARLSSGQFVGAFIWPLLGRPAVFVTLLAAAFLVPVSDAKAQCTPVIAARAGASLTSISTDISVLGASITAAWSQYILEIQGMTGSSAKSASKVSAKINEAQSAKMTSDLNNSFVTDGAFEIVKTLAPVPSQTACVLMTRQNRIDKAEADVKTNSALYGQKNVDMLMNKGASARGQNATQQAVFRDLTAKYWNPARPCPAGMTCGATNGADAILDPGKFLVTMTELSSAQQVETANDICRMLTAVAPSDPVASLTTPAARAAYLEKSQAVARQNLAIEPCLRLFTARIPTPEGSLKKILETTYSGSKKDTGVLLASETKAAAIEALATAAAAGSRLQFMTNQNLDVWNMIAATELSKRVSETGLAAVGN